MKIDEAQFMFDQSHNGTLREPNCMLTKDVKSIDTLLKCINALILFKNTNKYHTLFRKVKYFKYKLQIKSHKNVLKIKGNGSATNPYQIKTRFGNGEFFDLHSKFKNNHIPSYIEKGYCFANCMTFAIYLAQKNIESTVLTGISYFEKSYLHSVLLVTNTDNKAQVIDFNYDLVMDYELYLKLYSFEVLSRIEGQKFRDDRDILGDHRVNLKDYQLLLAYEDAIRYKKERLSLLDIKAQPSNEHKTERLKSKNQNHSIQKNVNTKEEKMPEIKFEIRGRIL